MPPKPSIPNFLLRSRSFWLSVFAMIFLVWAWNDSNNYQTLLSYGSETFKITAGSHAGGVIFLSNNPDPFLLFGLSIWREPLISTIINNPLHVDSLIAYATLNIKYSTLMILALFVSTAWLTWRWLKTVAALSKCHANK